MLDGTIYLNDGEYLLNNNKLVWSLNKVAHNITSSNKLWFFGLLISQQVLLQNFPSEKAAWDVMQVETGMLTQAI